MTKYNKGDVLEITRDFVLECALFSEGEKYTVIEVDRTFYFLEADGYEYTITISEVDARSGFRKVVPEVETVSVEALREAWEYVAHEYPDIEQLIKLAQRLS